MTPVKTISAKLVKKESESKVPSDLTKALVSTPGTMTLWKDLTPIARRDFITWIEGAKQPETRKRRIDITCSKLASGQRRPCCYAVVPMNFYKALGATPTAKAAWKQLTSTEKRDFVAWVEEGKDKETRGLRIEKACAMLSSGKRHP